MIVWWHRQSAKQKKSNNINISFNDFDEAVNDTDINIKYCWYIKYLVISGQQIGGKNTLLHFTWHIPCISTSILKLVSRQFYALFNSSQSLLPFGRDQKYVFKSKKYLWVSKSAKKALKLLSNNKTQCTIHFLSMNVLCYCLFR